MNKINFTKPKINYSEANKILAKVLKSGFINQGIKTRELETKICNFLKVKYAVTTTSGTAAIFLALKAAGVKKNDEVIVPNITFPATANAVKLAGAKPTLVDVNPKSLLIDQKS
jgi:dTDP-4-amino-4,6-dideoxygalactose transaminase